MCHPPRPERPHGCGPVSNRSVLPAGGRHLPVAPAYASGAMAPAWWRRYWRRRRGPRAKNLDIDPAVAEALLAPALAWEYPRTSPCLALCRVGLYAEGLLQFDDLPAHAGMHPGASCRHRWFSGGYRCDRRRLRTSLKPAPTSACASSRLCAAMPGGSARPPRRWASHAPRSIVASGRWKSCRRMMRSCSRAVTIALASSAIARRDWCARIRPQGAQRSIEIAWWRRTIDGIRCAAADEAAASKPGLAVEDRNVRQVWNAMRRHAAETFVSAEMPGARGFARSARLPNSSNMGVFSTHAPGMGAVAMCIVRWHAHCESTATPWHDRDTDARRAAQTEHPLEVSCRENQNDWRSQ